MQKKSSRISMPWETLTSLGTILIAGVSTILFFLCRNEHIEKSMENQFRQVDAEIIAKDWGEKDPSIGYFLSNRPYSSTDLNNPQRLDGFVNGKRIGSFTFVQPVNRKKRQATYPSVNGKPIIYAMPESAVSDAWHRNIEFYQAMREAAHKKIWPSISFEYVRDTDNTSGPAAPTTPEGRSIPKEAPTKDI
ncbi:MAG: hypothetical protein AB7E52_07380 [Bdellovibrionales bacterium]